ncbi:hypothetical protein H8E50_11735 [bacterium]|nr:hypothetical protein [bacterium]
MRYIVFIFGMITAIAGAMIIIRPDSIFNLIRKQLESLSLYIVAVVVRLILGIALIGIAAESKYPLAIEVIGWISIAAAIILGAIGPVKFKGLIVWALTFASSSIGRIGGVIALLFGCFLIYAVV